MARAVPAAEAGRTQRSAAPSATLSSEDERLLAAAGATVAAGPSDVGRTQVAARIEPPFRQAGNAFDSDDQPVAQAVGTESRSRAAAAGTGGFAQGVAGGPTLPRGLDGGFQRVVSHGGGDAS